MTIIPYVSLVYVVKWHTFFSQFHNMEIRMSHVREFFCDDDTLIEVFSGW